MKKITIVDPINCTTYHPTEGGVVIICSNTGIICTTQVGGIACLSPKVEGFPLYIDVIEPLDDFDDCKWGCINSLINDPKYLEQYGNEIDKYLKDNINGNNVLKINFEFDYERKNELMEGWWPVLIRFSQHERTVYKDGSVMHSYDDKESLSDTKFKGYLHFGNCD